jgi:hypothetical protein
MPSLSDIVAATGAEAPLYVPVYAELFEPIRRLPLAMLNSASTMADR